MSQRGSLEGHAVKSKNAHTHKKTHLPPQGENTTTIGEAIGDEGLARVEMLQTTIPGFFLCIARHGMARGRNLFFSCLDQQPNLNLDQQPNFPPNRRAVARTGKILVE